MMRKEKPIDLSPRDPKYPNPTTPRPTLMGVMPESKSVEFGRLPSGLRARVDELCGSIFKQRFYHKHGYSTR